MVRPLSFSVVGGATVQRLLAADWNGCLRTIESAYLALQHGHATSPPVAIFTPHDRPERRHLMHPAQLLEPAPVTGLKWLATYRENAARGLPRASGLVILNDPETGAPEACVEGSIIAAARTAGSAIVAAEHLATKSSGPVGFVGTGMIAHYLVDFLRARDGGRGLSEVHLYDPDHGARSAFKERFSGETRIREPARAEEILAACELVFVATTATRAHLDAVALPANPLLVSISVHDLGAGVRKLSQHIIDDGAQDLQELAPTPDGTLGQVLAGSILRDFTRPCIFSQLGLGILDVSIAKWILDRARADRASTEIADFFPRVRNGEN